MAEKTIKTKILLRYDVLSAWAAANPELKAGEVAIVAIPANSNELNINGTTPPQILFKVGPGEFNKLPYASGKAADVYSWAKEAKISIAKDGTGNVVSGIEWDATANEGKGGIKFTTTSVATSESLEDVQGRLAKLEAEIGDASNDYATSRIDTLEKTISDNAEAWAKDDNTTYTFSQNGKSFTVTPSEGEAKTITFDYLTATEVASAIEKYGYQNAEAVKDIVEEYLKSYYTRTEIDNKGFLVASDIEDKADKSYVDEELGKKADASALNDYYTKTEIDGQVDGLELLISGLDTKLEGALDDIEEIYGEKGEISTINGRLTEAEGKISTAEGKISILEGHFAEGGTVTGHINNKENPHGVTAAQVGAYTKEETNALFNPYRTSADQDVIDQGIKDDISGLKLSVGNLSGAFQFQGTKETVEELEPASSENIGHVYVVGNKEYASDGSSWILLGDEGSYVLKTTYEAHLETQAEVDKGQSDKIKAIEDDIKANRESWASKTSVTDPTSGDGKITVDGVEMVVYTLPEDVVKDRNYKHITVTETSVSDGTTTFNKYDDTALAGRVTTVEGKVKALEETPFDTYATKEEVEVERERINEIVTTTIPGINDTIKTLATKDEVKDAIANEHTHSNKAILDATSESFTTALKGKYEGYESSISGVAGKVTALENEFTTVGETKGRVVELEGKVKTLEETTVPALDNRIKEVEKIKVTSTSVTDGTNTFTKYDDTVLAGKVTNIENEFKTVTAEDGTETKGRVVALEDKFADWAIIWDCGGASNN